MIRPVATILGAGTPFTAALVEALRTAATALALPACELRMFGRDEIALEAMLQYARTRLGSFGWSASASTRLDEAVDGAAIVVNQIRFGGLAGRGRDEALARQFQLAADETLGPAGLCAALRAAAHLAELAFSLARNCPNAWVLNLANPLSATTAVLVRSGALRKCVGLCELPCVTAAEACRMLAVDFGEIDWRYAGFNHRGFILALKHRGADLLNRLPQALEGRTIFGITGDEIARLGALPLKYFHLSIRPAAFPPASRVPFLQALKKSIADEVRTLPPPPPSLSKRDFRWYETALVPMMAAILGQPGRELVVNTVREDGLCWELPARVFPDGVQITGLPVNGCARQWLRRWAEHERALLEAVESPSPVTVARALELDPSVPKSKVAAVSSAVWNAYRARA